MQVDLFNQPEKSVVCNIHYTQYDKPSKLPHNEITANSASYQETITEYVSYLENTQDLSIAKLKQIITEMIEINTSVMKMLDSNPSTLNNEKSQESCSMSLADAKALLNEHKDKEGMKCPCCNQFAKVYRRNLNSSMAYGLIKFYMAVQNTNRFLHAPSVFTRLGMNFMNTEFSRLKHWGLVEERADTPDADKKTSGYWRVTEKGRDFVLGHTRVPKYIFLYDSQICEEYSDPAQIDINEALGSKFSYQEIMKETVKIDQGF